MTESTPERGRLIRVSDETWKLIKDKAERDQRTMGATIGIIVKKAVADETSPAAL